MNESDLYQAEPLPRMAPRKPSSMLVIGWLGAMLAIEIALLTMIYYTLTH